MKRLRKPARRPALALDFGVSSITVAAATGFGKDARILDVISLPPDPEELVRLVAERGWKGARTRVVIQGEHLFWRPTPAPKLGRRHLTGMLSLESRKYAGDLWADCHWNYRRSRGPASNAAHQTCIVAAGFSRAVLEWKDLLLRAGLVPSGMMPFPEAVRHLLPAAETASGAVATIDFGATRCRMAIIHQGEAVLFRHLALGGRHLTEELLTIAIPGRAAFNFSPVEAEDLKRRHGLTHEPGSEAQENGLPLGQITASLRPVLERLVREIYSSFDYWSERTMGVPLREIRLIGGGARLPGLAGYLETVLGLPVRLAEAPLTPVTGDVFSGILAIGAVRSRGFVDLGQATPPGDLDLWESRLTWSRAALLLVLYAGVGGGFGLFQWGREATSRAIWQGRLKGQEAQAEMLRRVEEMEARASRQAEIHRTVAMGSPDWPRIMAGISNRIGSEARLMEMSLEMAPAPDGSTVTPVLHISGRVTGESEPPLVVARLLEDLSRVQGLKPFEFVSTMVDDAGYDAFDIRSAVATGSLP